MIKRLKNIVNSNNQISDSECHLTYRSSGIFDTTFNRDSGFTLIEILVALLLIMITLVPLLMLFVSAGNVSRINAKYLEATILSTGTLEFVQSLPPSSVGYYEDEFSTTNSNYPPNSTNVPSEWSVFNGLFGTVGYGTLPASFASGEPVYLAQYSPGNTITTSSATAATNIAADLVQPVIKSTVANTNYYIYTVVTWHNTTSAITSSTSDCAYAEIDVHTYWDNFKNSLIESNFAYGIGSGVNSNSTLSPGQQCSSSAGSLSSTAPNSPTAVTASLVSPPTNPPSVTVAWTETSANTAPVGYYVIEWSNSSTMTTSSQPADPETSAPEPPGSPNINPTTVSSTTTTTTTNYSYQINGLSYNTTYYVTIWAFSQDGTQVTQSSTTVYLPGSTTTGVTTQALPSTVTACTFSSILGTFLPTSTGSLTGLTPVQTGKTYLSSTGHPQENLSLEANYSNDCSTATYSIEIGTYSQGSFTNILDVPLGNVTTTGGTMYYSINLITSNVPVGNYLLQLNQGTGSSAVPVANVPESTILICPYVNPGQRSTEQNKC